MSRIPMVALVLAAFAAAVPPLALASLDPSSVHVAEHRKTGSYVADGIVVGGDRMIDDVTVKDIRHSIDKGYERLVIDLQGTLNGEPAAIPRPPYYQVSVTPDEKRLVLTVFGHPKLELDSRKVMKAFRRSAVVQGIELMPKLEDETWSFAVDLKSGRPVEVFELSNPVRIIVDIRSGRR